MITRSGTRAPNTLLGWKRVMSNRDQVLTGPRELAEQWLYVSKELAGLFKGEASLANTQSGQRFPSDGKVKGIAGNHGEGGRKEG